MWSCQVAVDLNGHALRAAGNLLAALFCAGCDRELAAGPDSQAAAVRGTSFQVTAADGTIVSSPDLAGAVIGFRQGTSTAKIRIDAVSTDVADGSDVYLHAISIEGRDGTWRPLCQSAAKGSQGAFPLAGRVSSDGRLLPSTRNEFEIVCASGARGKCVRLGYRPWERLPDGSDSRPLFNACVRMILADYAGTGRSMTRDGTAINLADNVGIHRANWRHAFPFEAGWDEFGAVCVHHPRIKAIASLDQIIAISPRLKGRAGKMCTPEKAESLGALIFNGSRE